MQSAGTRLDPVTAAVGSAHARGRKERSVGGGALRGWAIKDQARLTHYGLRRRDVLLEVGMGSGKVATRRRC